MAIPYETPIPDENSAFASMRDSLYILMNTNQYGMKPIISMTKEAEGLLRIVLFSEDLQLVGSKKTLKQLREKLARELRSNRRRGVVPVFVSTLWFLFALAISIQAAFGYLGDNAQAHYLALGLFMSWFPVLVLCSIVDRNPVASDDIKRKLNKLVDLVCDSLIDPETRNAYIDSLKDSPGCERMAYWVEKISKQAPFIKEDFFTDFAGQGRKRFHYGAAHAILLDIEAAYIADRGRNWLANEPEARGRLVLGRVEEGLVSFDGRQLWQVLASFGCVAGTSTGAFLLSYFTPTVGLSCRSGGFLVFGVTCLALLLAEYGIWWYTSPVRTGKLHEMVERRTSFQSERSMAKARNHHRIPHRRHIESNQRFWTAAENTAIRISRICIRVLPMKNRHTRIETAISAIHTHIATLQTWTLRDWSEVLFFTPIEFLNTVWLVVLTMAQTIGAFVTCACQCSIWGFGGGYLDFTQWQVSNSPHIYEFWLVGTVVSCVCMGVGFVYIVLEVSLTSCCPVVLFYQLRWAGESETDLFVVVPASSLEHGELRRCHGGIEESSTLPTVYVPGEISRDAGSSGD